MSIWSAIKRAWSALDYVPDCPTCHGQGVAPFQANNTLVWWHGRQEWACWQCNGAGKV